METPGSSNLTARKKKKDLNYHPGLPYNLPEQSLERSPIKITPVAEK